MTEEKPKVNVSVDMDEFNKLMKTYKKQKKYLKSNIFEITRLTKGSIESLTIFCLKRYTTVNEALRERNRLNFAVKCIADDVVLFTHVFYSNHQPVSRFFPLIQPIVDQIDPHIVKSFTCRSQPELIQHNFHDVDNCITAIYYVIQTGGKTVFESTE